MVASLRRGTIAGIAFLIAMVLCLPTSRSAAFVAVPGLLVTTASAMARDVPLFTMDMFFPNPQQVVQAVGPTYQRADNPATDRHAYLRSATELPLDAPGVRVMGPGLRRNFGTYELVELIRQVGVRFEARFPEAAIRVGDLSTRRGGTIRDERGRRVHSSHRNGLDADIMYLRSDCGSIGRFDRMECPVDIEETLELMRTFVDGGPPGVDTLVDVIFVGMGVQRRICKVLAADPRLADRYGRVVQRVQAMGGHGAHFHVRLRCPEHSRRCPPPRTERPALCSNLGFHLAQAPSAR